MEATLFKHAATLKTLATTVRIAFLWTAGYAISQALIFPKRSVDFNNRVISLVHAVVAMGLCALSVNPTHPFAAIGGGVTAQEKLTLQISLGYFLYDLVYCAVIERSVANTLHHVATIAGLVVGVFLEQSGAELVLCLLLMEMSNPFMHLRAMFKEMGMKDSGLATANEISFAMMFMLGRIVLGPLVVFYTLNSDANMVVKVGGLGIQVVSLFWFWKILQVVLYKVRKSKRGTTSTSHEKAA